MEAASVASLGHVPLLLYCCRCRPLRIRKPKPKPLITGRWELGLLRDGCRVGCFTWPCAVVALLLPMPPAQDQKTETESAVFSSKPNRNRPTLASMKP